MSTTIRVLLIAFAWMMVTWVNPVASEESSLSPSPSPSPSASPPASPQESCSQLIYDMSECISFIGNGSEETQPTSGCCTGFETVVKTDVSCICESLMSSANLGLELNMTRALALPSMCGVSTDAFSGCSVDSIPSSDPPPPVTPPLPSPPRETPTVPSPPPSQSPKPLPRKAHAVPVPAETPSPSPSPSTSTSTSTSTSPSPSHHLHKGASSRASAASPTIVALSMLLVRGVRI